MTPRDARATGILARKSSKAWVHDRTVSASDSIEVTSWFRLTFSRCANRVRSL
jgi:hypothetical protein